MTATELRTLLEQAEAHGGPVESHVGEIDDLWITTEDSVRVQTLSIPVHDSVADHLVGVLKRDLEAKGCIWGAHCHASTASLRYEAEIHATPGRTVAFAKQCRSELEALLRAWLAAAEAEGWTS